MWGNCPVLCQRAMDRTLTRCVHYILHDNAALLSQRVFDDTFICTFNYLVTISNAFCVYKTINSAPLDDFSSFTLLSTVLQRLSRASESKKLVLPQLCFKAGNLIFLYAGASVWSSLSNVFISLTNFAAFKRHVMQYVHSRIVLLYLFYFHSLYY